jgi:uncharacterized metal-binding protein
MGHRTTLRCAACHSRDCVNGKDCIADAERQRALYEIEGIARLHRAASAVEARHYGREPRIREVILLAQEMGYHKIGMAFCVGLADEARVIADILTPHFELTSVCCKLCGIEKRSLDLERIDPENESEVMCNPVGQATILNEAETQMNILCGLCVGHDSIFSMVSRAPVTTLVVKDRVLAHNPLGAIYSRYTRRGLLPPPPS